MRRSQAVSAFSVVAVAALVLSACGGGESGDPNSGASGDIKSMATGKAQQGDNFKLGEAPESDQVIIGIDQGYSGYNNETPDANNSYNTFVLTAVLSGSYQLDGNNKVLLNTDVMESWRVTQPSPQVVEWKLKPNVKWSDGGDWDCDDFYLAWLARNGNPKQDGKPVFISTGSDGYELIADATCKDNLTFEAKFSQPYLDYKSLFNPTSVMPAHVLEQKTGVADVTALKPTGDIATLKKAGEFWSKEWKAFKPDIMPSSGPYKITAFDTNSKQITLEKNPLWLGAKGGPKRIIVKAIPDTKAMATAVQNGEIDVASSVQPDATAAETLKGLSSQGVTYGSAPRLSFEHLDLNLDRLFADPATRKAFFQAVDRQEITDKLIKPVQGDAQPLNNLLFFPGEPGFEDNYTAKIGQGAEAAAKTLTDAGWVKGADGVFAKDGKRFSVTVTHNENARRDQTVEIIIPQLKAAGIEIKNETDPAFLKGRLDKGEWDVALYGWSSTPFKSEQASIYVTGGGQNHQGLSDAKVDEGWRAAGTAVDEDAARKAYQATDRALADTYASLPLFQTPSMWGFRGIDRVFMQSYLGVLWNVGEWTKTG
ncbi:ABC transporter family substrate-binding protein [Amycolatopsis nigrescens]|uniref:ABC transporter family substrate-binding protein n=1 Tax=Amycolatopsis nigrescens TaxID=381445 RepID=UPI000477DBDD|nr:ABC transporter family substrate-binding protein [Amycolatopsis nigrescens]